MGALLLVYTLIAGMVVPLKPGIQQVDPSSVRTGEEVALQVRGYNTQYTRQSKGIRAWLKLDDARALGAARIDVTDDRELSIIFAIPEYLPVGQKVRDFSLIIDDAYNGAMVYPSAVFITQDSIDPAMGARIWTNTPIERLNEPQMMTFPFRNILSETIRNTYFHVPLWFGMLFLFLGSVVFSVRYLRGGGETNDRKAVALTRVGIFFGVLGLVTGAIWAKNTWGAYWSWDVKQNMTAVALLIYLAYFVLRNSFDDQERQARLGAVYNIFAFATLIPLVYVIPRMTDSLHPGAGGNPAFGSQDLDNTMRMVFYPAILGWTLIGYWIASLSYRAENLKARLLERESLQINEGIDPLEEQLIN